MLPSVLIAIMIGVSLGLIPIIFIKITRGQQTTRNSLLQLDQLVGSTAIVILPFDYTGQGKVRVKTHNGLIEYPYTFSKGEKVIIIGLERSQLWVISYRSAFPDQS